MSVFDRLREERSRLGLAQQDVADLCEVHLKTAQRWEGSVPIPSDQLQSLAAQGFDVQYIVSGVRSENAPRSASASTDAALTAEEWKLVKLFRSLAERERPTAMRLVEVIAAGGNPAGSVTATHGGRAAGRDIVEGPKKR